MFRRNFLFSIFNIAARTYSSQVIRLNQQICPVKHPTFAQKTSFTVQFANMSSGDTKLITYDELRTLKDNTSVMVIDVREPEELKETGVIPGSINIPLKDLENTLKVTSDEKFLSKYDREKPKLSTPLVFSCKAGIRSEQAQNIALKLGYSKDNKATTIIYTFCFTLFSSCKKSNKIDWEITKTQNTQLARNYKGGWMDWEKHIKKT